MSSEALQIYRPDPIKPVTYTPEEIALFGETYAKGCDPNEIALAVAIAGQLGFSLLARQVHAIKRYDSKLKRDVLTIVVGIDGFRAQADRTGLWEGVSKPEFMDADGEWLPYWTNFNKMPVACRIKAFRRGFREPREGVAYWHEKAQKVYDQQAREWRLSSQWVKQPITMISKCAESAALRAAFPTHMANIFIPEEVDPDLIEGEVEETGKKGGLTPPPPPQQAEPRKTRTRSTSPGPSSGKPADAKEPASTPSQAKAQTSTATPPTAKENPEHKAAVEQLYAVFTKYDARKDPEDNLDQKETARAVKTRLTAIRDMDSSLVPPIADDVELRAWLAPLTPQVINQIRQAYIDDAEEEIRSPVPGDVEAEIDQVMAQGHMFGDEEDTGS